LFVVVSSQIAQKCGKILYFPSIYFSNRMKNSLVHVFWYDIFFFDYFLAKQFMKEKYKIASSTRRRSFIRKLF